MAQRSSGPFAIKDHKRLIADTEAGEEGSLKRAVGALDLTALGIGAVIGTGIFVVIGEGIGEAGPAVILSFGLAALTCLFAALCYAELASSIPVSGSAYTYAYATLGELVAWIIGWDLILEYGVSVAAVAVGWGGNLNEFLENAFGYALPESISTAREDGGILNLPAVAIVIAVMFLLSRGVRETARANLVMVGVKLVILAFFIVVAFSAAFSADNLKPFAPEGADGVVSAAAIIFFAYIGFDAVSTGAEEAKQPKRDLPLAIVGSLVICTIIYILTAIAAVGSLPAKELAESDAPLAAVLDEGAGISWAASLLAFGALIAITSVLVTIFYGQTRIFFAMARDGLLPRGIARVNPRTGTPVRLTIGMGIAIAALAAVAPLSQIVKLVNIGTLSAFFLVNIGVVILRHTQPDMERPFRVPLASPKFPLFPVIGCLLIIYLVITLPGETWIRFVVWLALGLVIYFFYGRRHSRLQMANERGEDGVSIVVGHDGTEGGDDASTLGAQLANATGEELVIVTVYPEENPIGAGRVDAEWVAYMRSNAEESNEAARTFLEAAGVAAAYRVVGSHSAAHGLDDVAEAVGASMIVVGSSPRGPRRRILAGSTAERLLHGASCPVAVAPRGVRERPANAPVARIGVAFVDSDEAREALSVAVALAQRASAALTLYTVVAPRAEFSPVAGRASEESLMVAVRESVRASMDAALAGLPSGMEAADELLEGDVVDELASLDDHECDLLVCGSRGYGPLRRVLLGGVSRKLMRHAACPVMVVPR